MRLQVYKLATIATLRTTPMAMKPNLKILEYLDRERERKEEEDTDAKLSKWVKYDLTIFDCQLFQRSTGRGL